MTIFPAIDIQKGTVVRLRQGRFDQITEYADDPISVAEHWVSQGAEGLHIIDLDGAKKGEMANFSIIAQIARKIRVPLQVGGGVRNETDVNRLLDAGVQRVILGTRAIEDRTFLKKILICWPDKIAVSLDCKDGKVALRGWATVSELSVTAVAKELESLGLRCLIYTDIRRDGMLTGPDYEGLQTLLQEVKTPLIASGGIKELSDVKRLNALGPRPLLGAITGKALYERTLNLREAIAACSAKE